MHFTHFWVHLVCDPAFPLPPSPLSLLPSSCSNLDLISVVVHICEQGGFARPFHYAFAQQQEASSSLYIGGIPKTSTRDTSLGGSHI